MQTFTSPAPVSAVLDIPAGSVRFIASDRADAPVEVLPADASHGRDVKAAEQTEVRYADGTLRIGSPAKSRILYAGARPAGTARGWPPGPRRPAGARADPGPDGGARAVPRPRSAGGARAFPTRRSPCRGAWCSAACPRPR